MNDCFLKNLYEQLKYFDMYSWNLLIICNVITFVKHTEIWIFYDIDLYPAVIVKFEQVNTGWDAMLTLYFEMP